KWQKNQNPSAGDNINAKLQLVMKSGKYQFGRKSCLKALRTGKGKLGMVSRNCPSKQRREIENYAMRSKCGVHEYHGDNNDLGTA
ncbi:hypothetical protein PFDG_05064, partial [Plasmodium falciparum Dd2]